MFVVMTSPTHCLPSQAQSRCSRWSEGPGPSPPQLGQTPDWKLVLQSWSEGVWVDMIVMETDITVLYYCASGCDVVGVCLFVILFIDSDVCVCLLT